MYENGRPVESMEVVVGKTTQPTPILAGLIRYVAVDPYWNMPPAPARDQLAPKVLQQGLVKRAPSPREFAPGRDIQCAGYDSASVMNNNHCPSANLAECRGKSHGTPLSLSTGLKYL
jgi:hypothetical protein